MSIKGKCGGEDYEEFVEARTRITYIAAQEMMDDGAIATDTMHELNLNNIHPTEVASAMIAVEEFIKNRESHE